MSISFPERPAWGLSVSTARVTGKRLACAAGLVLLPWLGAAALAIAWLAWRRMPAPEVAGSGPG